MTHTKAKIIAKPMPTTWINIGSSSIGFCIFIPLLSLRPAFQAKQVKRTVNGSQLSDQFADPFLCGRDQLCLAMCGGLVGQDTQLNFPWKRLFAPDHAATPNNDAPSI
jgi:hypothetical protein